MILELNRRGQVSALMRKPQTPSRMLLSAVANFLSRASVLAMGGHLSRLLTKLSDVLQEFSNRKEARILMLGLDNAGKTTILNKLKLKDEGVHTLPTIGFNVETLSPCKNVTFTVWDVGGQEHLRPLWRHYIHGTDGVVYVVDSSDRERFPEAKKELVSLLRSYELSGVPVILLANKQDVRDAAGPQQVAEELKLCEISQNPWYLQATCATTGEGIVEAIEKLAALVKDFQARTTATKDSIRQ